MSQSMPQLPPIRVNKLPIVPLPNPHLMRATKSPPIGVLSGLQTRARLVLGAVVLTILTVAVLSQTLGAYTVAYEQFRGIVEDNSVLVDASEQALQYVAGASTAAADLIGTAAGSKANIDAGAAIYSSFQNFRNEMFQLRAGLNGRETALYNAIETSVYDKFWPQLGIVVADQQSGNKDGARTAFTLADKELENTIAADLQQIETTNFQAMVDAEQRSGGIIVGQAILLGILALALAGLLTVLSFWLRRTIRRYLTPGLDVAMVLGWVLLIGTMVQLLGLPEQLRSMVEDAYYSVTASSRVLAVANQGNRAESAALIDLGNVTVWQQNFDQYSHEVELRMCGQKDCLKPTFLSTSYAFASNSSDTIDPNVLSNAKAISANDLHSIGGVVPLVANVTYPGEAQTLEAARRAYQDYWTIDGQTRQLIAANRIPEAIALNTGTAPGQSDEAFSRFSTAMEKEKVINRTVFDTIWHTQRDSLPSSRLMFGLAGYALLILLLAAGVYHRFREL